MTWTSWSKRPGHHQVLVLSKVSVFQHFLSNFHILLLWNMPQLVFHSLYPFCPYAMFESLPPYTLPKLFGCTRFRLRYLCLLIGLQIMPNGERIRAMQENSEYRYLGVLEGDDVKNEKVKHLVSEEYNRRLNRMLKSTLNSGYLIKAINTYAVAAIRYTVGIVKWNKEKLDTLDRKTRKRLTTYRGFHPKSDVDRLCMWREAREKGVF